jgi:CheY-like chemotaxis protein
MAKKVILSIEDDIHLLQGIRDILELDDYEVLGTINPIEGLEIARVSYPDLILLDIMMPYMDGYQVLAELRKDPKLTVIPVIFLTARGEKSDIRHGLKMGVDDYIVKPFTSDDLLLRVESVFYRRELLEEATKRLALEFKNHVFLSYSRKDDVLMRRVGDYLKNQSFIVWVDEEGLEPGTRSWRRTVQDAIDGAGCLAVILSPDAKESPWVEAELAYAEAQSKTIFPILARGDKSNAVPFGYNLAQWIDIVQKDFDVEMGNLTKAIRKCLTSR